MAQLAKSKTTVGGSVRAHDHPLGTVDERLGVLIQHIAMLVRPRRIILFGSAARGELTPESDLDILVVMPDGTHRRHTAQLLYRCLPAVGIAKDIVVVTESDILNYGQNPSLVLYPALREGVEVYVAEE